jgi:hypothetical protein
MSQFSTIVLLVASGGVNAALSAPFQQTMTLEEAMGFAWESDLVHRDLAVPKPGALYPHRAVLLQEKAVVPMQFDAVERYPDGSVKKAQVWFRTDLPARGVRTFTLTATTDKKLLRAAARTDLVVKRSGNVLEIGNGLTAVRLPAGKTRAGRGDGGVGGWGGGVVRKEPAPHHLTTSPPHHLTTRYGCPARCWA